MVTVILGVFALAYGLFTLYLRIFSLKTNGLTLKGKTAD